MINVISIKYDMLKITASLKRVQLFLLKQFDMIIYCYQININVIINKHLNIKYNINNIPHIFNILIINCDNCG